MEVSNSKFYENSALRELNETNKGIGGAIHTTRVTDNPDSEYEAIIKDCELNGNISTYKAGAVYAASGDGSGFVNKENINKKRTFITDSHFQNNKSMHGGAIVSACQMIINGTTAMTENEAYYGGAVWNQGRGSNIHLSDDVTIEGNRATDFASGIGVVDDGFLSIKGNVKITEDNDVYLYDGTFVNINGELTNPNFHCRVTPRTYELAKRLVTVSYDDKVASDEYFEADKETAKFSLTPSENYILRPGDLVVN